MIMQKKSFDRYKSFVDCLSDFSESKNRDVSDSFVLSGIVQKYCLTFDLAWKVMKDIIIEQYAIINFIVGSPKEVLRVARNVDLINDDIWLQMLSTRNELTYDYNRILAEEYVDDIVYKYIDVFVALKNKVEEFYK